MTHARFATIASGASLRGEGPVLDEARPRSERPPPVSTSPSPILSASVRPPGRRHWRWIAVVAASTVVLAGMAYATRPARVLAVSPSRGPAVEAVYANGVIEAINYARIEAIVSGRIVALPIDEGMTVRRGDILASLDDRQARARLADARARQKMAEADVARDQALASRGVLAAQSLERGEEERDQAAAAAELAARQLEDLTVASPLDGVVMKRDVEPGEVVAANQALFEIASTDRKRIAADVDERDIPNVRPGSRLVARADGFPDRAFEARVTNIRQQGDTSTRTFRVEADLPADTPLAIGMSVDVDIVIAERANATLVPADAMLHGPSQGGRAGPAYLFVARDAHAKRIDVELGAVGAGKAEILSGVDDADKVIVDPPAGLKDGAAVQVTS